MILVRAVEIAVLATGILMSAPVAVALPARSGSTSGVESAVATATTSSLSVSPASGTSATVFQVTASVAPNPGAGTVRITAWSASSAGSLEWDRSVSVDSTGTATVLGGVSLDPGTYWWQADFLGNTSYGSSSSTRHKVTVTGLISTISNTHVQWADPGQDIQFGADGTSNGARGKVDLVVDGDVHAVCNSGETCSAVNNLPLGLRDVFLRYVSSDPDWGTASGTVVTYNNGPTLPPASGILVDGGRASTANVGVTINVAYGDSGQDVDGIRLSNSSATVDGNLAQPTDVSLATTVNWGLTAAWTLAPGVDGSRVVYAQLHRTDDTWTSVVSDAILLDTTPPSGSIVINGGAETIGDAWGASVPEQHLTGTVSDNSFISGGSIVRVGISNDGVRYFDMPFQMDPLNVDLIWQVLYDPYGHADVGPGDKTVYVKWQDEAGSWSAPATDSIRYVGEDAVGSLKVEGSPAQVAPDPLYLSNPTPTLTITLDSLPPEGIKSVKVYGHNDQGFKKVDWTGSQTTAAVAWSLVDSSLGYSAQDGLKDLTVQVTSQTGRVREIGALLILDRSIPLSQVPVPAFAPDSVVDQTTTSSSLTTTTVATTELQWSAQSGKSVSRYTLQKKQGTTWASVTLPTATTSMAVQGVNVGSSNQYRVRAAYTSGTTSTWQKTASYSMQVIQENDSRITYSGSWRTDASSDALGGHLRSTGTQGAFAKFTFTGRAFAWIAPRSAGSNASVYVDGKLLKTVILAGTNEPRRVVFSVAWKSAGQHTVKIVKKYVTNRLPIDAFLVLA